MHDMIPMHVGSATPISAHFRLCVSLYIVRVVVEHGQCATVKTETQIAELSGEEKER